MGQPPIVPKNTAKMAQVMARAWELKVVDGMTLDGICEAIAKEFRLKRVPCRDTLRGWMKNAKDYLRDPEEITGDYVHGTLELVRRMHGKWAPIALAETLQVQRKKMMDGEIGFEVVEEHVEEQLKASKALLDWNKRGADILGIGKTENNKEGDTTTFHLTLIKSFHETIMQPGQKSPPDRDVLVLGSGDPLIDALEAELIQELESEGSK